MKISADGKTYVFPIRKGVKFHNGKELDAERTSSPRSSATARSARRRRCSRADRHGQGRAGPHEVTITLKDVQSTFLDNLSSPRAPIAIYPAEEAAKAANQINYIGTGPFRFVEYKPDSHVKIARFDGYVPNPQCDGPRRLRRQEGGAASTP